jgi:uncharacterized protein YkwD
MFSRRFPRSASLAGVSQAIILISSLSLVAGASFAKDGTPKSSERQTEQRPVARLIGSPRQQVPQSTRARLVSRMTTPQPTSYTPAQSYTPATSYARTATPAASFDATGDERRAFELVNAERQKRGLRPLVWDASLARLARYHSATMARDGVLSHTDRDGLDLSGRAQVLGLHGWRALGENIAYNQGFSDPTAFAVERWMISQAHRENILNGGFTHAGLGIARAADGRIFFTQVFMER